MEKIDTFNIRVYAIIEHFGKILLIREYYAGENLIKFPGGGLEYGEGIIEALERELKEELNIELKSFTHFYTQEDFLRSKFNLNQQIITIYYRVEVSNIDRIKIIDKQIHEIIWQPINKLKEIEIPLPIDKLVVDKIVNK